MEAFQMNWNDIGAINISVKPKYRKGEILERKGKRIRISRVIISYLVDEKKCIVYYHYNTEIRPGKWSCYEDSFEEVVTN